MSVLPGSGTYKLSAIKLSSNSGARAVSDIPDYYGLRKLTLGTKDNPIYSTATVTFATTADGGHQVSVKSGTMSLTFIPTVEYETADRKYVIVGIARQDGTVRDYFLFASAGEDTSKLKGQTLNLYFNPKLGKNLGYRYFTTSNGLSFTDTTVKDNGKFDPCYLSGTLIRTPTGPVSVDDLSEGDEISVLCEGREETRPIIWAGKTRIYVRKNMPDDLAGYPVRIVRNALGDNVPSDDLLITPEHCLSIDGQFIPVRMLVNGHSIRYDYHQRSYDIYHIETREHSVIWANDALSESYLDTGNRHLFNPAILFLGENSQKAIVPSKASAIPLVTDHRVIEPIFRRLKQRAGLISAPRALPASGATLPSVTEEPGFYLTACRKDKIALSPLRRKDEWWIFPIPPKTREIVLHSRTSRPFDTIGPFVDDRRKLGVLVAGFSYFVDNREIPLDLSPLEEEQNGWHSEEQILPRWTNGQARLRLPPGFGRNPALLGIRILPVGKYILPSDAMLANIPFENAIKRAG